MKHTRHDRLKQLMGEDTVDDGGTLQGQYGTRSEAIPSVDDQFLQRGRNGKAVYVFSFRNLTSA